VLVSHAVAYERRYFRSYLEQLHIWVCKGSMVNLVVGVVYLQHICGEKLPATKLLTAQFLVKPI